MFMIKGKKIELWHLLLVLIVIFGAIYLFTSIDFSDNKKEPRPEKVSKKPVEVEEIELTGEETPGYSGYWLGIADTNNQVIWQKNTATQTTMYLSEDKQTLATISTLPKNSYNIQGLEKVEPPQNFKKAFLSDTFVLLQTKDEDVTISTDNKKNTRIAFDRIAKYPEQGEDVKPLLP